eukprot:TRINITY_DN700_c0_g1_i2.p1 TRINITY_DN700_c0_g1~~TRINITY_DN700_c0_g1_i2.p1  ORF type:complete len:730 (+),score=148.34 TRINITY_DN700_c0_g1_i2:368-2557(+)
MKEGKSIPNELNVAALSLDNSLSQGYLYYGLKGNRKKKKSLFGILNGEFIYFFVNDGAKKPKMIVSLQEYSSCVSESSLEFRLEHNTEPESKTLYFRSDTTDEKNVWCDSLRVVLNNIRDFSKKYAAGQTRIEYSLFTRVSEVRKIPKPVDSYISILTDGIQKGRTPTFWMDQNPAYNQEFEFDINEDTQSITFALRNDSRKREILGVATFDVKDVLLNEIEGWFPLNTIQDSSNIILASGSLLVDAYIGEGKLHVNAREAKNVFCSIDTPSPYLKILFGNQERRSTTKKKTDFPVWNFETEFDIPVPEPSDLTIEIWSKEDFGGSVTLQISELNTAGNAEWYDFESEIVRETFGDIRISLQCNESVILNDRDYEELLIALMHSDMGPVKKLGQISTKKEKQMAECFVKAFQCKKSAVHLIKNLCDEEILRTSDPNIIFRGNTMATKSADTFMRIIGGNYIKDVLQEIIQSIIAESSKKSCELDPYRLDPSLKQEKQEKILSKNLRNLIGYVDSVFQAITSSLDVCPLPFRSLFERIQATIMTHFENDTIAKYRAPGGFIFLRFFCPGLIAPKLFGLVSEHPTPEVSRVLTLIAKTLQNIANLTEFGKKEPFMEPLNEYIVSRYEDLKDFIDSLCTVPEVVTEQKYAPVNLNFGKEMSRVQYHVNSVMSVLYENFGEDDEDLAVLRESLMELDEKVQKAKNEIETEQNIESVLEQKNEKTVARVDNIFN